MTIYIQESLYGTQVEVSWGLSLEVSGWALNNVEFLLRTAFEIIVGIYENQTTNTKAITSRKHQKAQKLTSPQ